MKQHFLPVCYLKEFVNLEGKIHSIDISLLKYNREVFDEAKYPAEVCRSIDFYTIQPKSIAKFPHMRDLRPLHLEESFHFYEREYPKIVNKIKSGQRALILKDAELLLYAIVDFKIRNIYFREKIVPKAHKNIIEDNLNRMKQEIRTTDLESLNNITKEDFLKALDKVQKDFDPTPENHAQSHLSSMALRRNTNDQVHTKIVRHLLEFEWLILMSNNQFITNDNPGVSIDKNNVVQNTKFDKDYIFFFSLTPSHVLSVNPRILDLRFKQVKSQKNLHFRTAGQQFIDAINEMHGYHLSRYIFANNSRVIGQIIERINKKAKQK